MATMCAVEFFRRSWMRGAQVGFFQVRAHVVELVDGHQHVVEVGGGELLVGVTQRGVRAHQHRIGAVFQEPGEGRDFAGVGAGSAQVIGGATVQSAKNPCEVRSVLAKDWPIERSGTATITLRTPWLYSLSRATNMSARLLPEAGGALISRCCALRCSYTLCCISRMPSWFVFTLLPDWA